MGEGISATPKMRIPALLDFYFCGACLFALFYSSDSRINEASDGQEYFLASGPNMTSGLIGYDLTERRLKA